MLVKQKTKLHFVMQNPRFFTLVVFPSFLIALKIILDCSRIFHIESSAPLS